MEANALQRPAALAAKRRSLLLVAALVSSGVLSSQALGKAPVVHEWGTFTTLVSSAGEPLEGLYVDATRLPSFVHGLPFFNYDAVNGWPKADKLKGVTVKMETPVLYFYSDGAMDITAKVGFKGGTISQWFPQRASGEANPAGPVDMDGEPYEGSIAWKARVLAKSDTRPFSHANGFGGDTHEWRAPRATAANLVEGQNGEIEKFLFYRGLGNFPSSVALLFEPSGKLVIRNAGADPIPFLLIYDLVGPALSGTAAIWWQGPLAAGASVTAAKPTAPDYSAGMAAMESLHAAMVKAGLYGDEARALLNTWYNGYFIETGLKAFWVVPRKQVDRILPLELSPAPDSLERVIIGRSEILTPEFEAKLLAEGGALPSHAKDKHYLAYLDFLAKARAHPSKVMSGERVTSMRPWSGVLPWQGPLASPGFSARDGRGSKVFRDLRGRSALP